MRRQVGVEGGGQQHVEVVDDLRDPVQVVGHVAEVGRGLLVDAAHLGGGEAAHRLAERHHGAAYLRDLPLERVDADRVVGAGGEKTDSSTSSTSISREAPTFSYSSTTRSQMAYITAIGPCSSTLARCSRSAARPCQVDALPVPDGDHEVRADEDVDLAGLDGVVLVDVPERLEDDEERVAVALDLGALVGVAGVLDRERVQVEGRRRSAGAPRRSGRGCPIHWKSPRPHGHARVPEAGVLVVEGDAHALVVEGVVDDHAVRLVPTRVAGMATVILVRHGRTDRQRHGRAGRSAARRPARRPGHEQAVATAARLAPVRLVAAVYEPARALQADGPGHHRAAGRRPRPHHRAPAQRVRLRRLAGPRAQGARQGAAVEGRAGPAVGRRVPGRGVDAGDAGPRGRGRTTPRPPGRGRARPRRGLAGGAATATSSRRSSPTPSAPTSTSSSASRSTRRRCRSCATPSRAPYVLGTNTSARRPVLAQRRRRRRSRPGGVVPRDAPVGGGAGPDTSPAGS